jgi:cytochrome c biogenesis protein CcdA/glutaredoxin
MNALRRSTGILLAALLVWFLGVYAEAVEMLFFYENGCPHCARVKAFLDTIAPDYPDLVIHYFDIHEAESPDLLDRLLAVYKVKLGPVPIVFVGDVVGIAGTYYGLDETPYETAGRSEEMALLRAIDRAMETDAESPLTRVEDVQGGGLAENLTIPALIVAAVVDSVNPCTFAVLVLLLGTLIVAGRKGRVLQIGISFIVAIYVSYFLMGIGIFTAIQAAGVQKPFILAVSSLAILLGLWNMKDYFAYGKWFTIEVPQRWRPAVKRLTASVISIPGAFLVGVLDSLFLLPCSSGPYIAILALLSKTTSRLQGILFLLLYNFIFILPLLGIMLAVHFGFTTTARAERWRQKRLGKLHLITGAIMTLLGIMLISMQLGYL